MIKACARDGDVEGACAIVESLRASGAALSPMIRNGLLDVCAQCRDLTRAEALFGTMKAELVADVVSFNIMLKLYLFQGHHAKAQELVQEMVSLDLPPNKVTFNELLNSRVEANDRSGAWNLVSEMTAAGVAPNSVTCSILLKALGPRSAKSEVERTLALV